MKKGKLKKFLSLFSSFAIGCSTLFMLTGCPRPETVTVAEFSYTIGSKESDQTEFEYKNTDYVLHLYTTKDFYGKIYVRAIDNETNNEEDIEFYQADWNNDRKRSEVTLIGADYTKTCMYTIYASDNETAPLDECVSKTFKIIVGSNPNPYPTPVITKQPAGATYYYNTSASGPYYSDSACTQATTIKALSVESTITEGEISYQWYNTTSAISGATSSSYTPTASGSYYVVVSNKDHASSSVTSETAIIVFSNANNPTPVITTDIVSASYDKIELATALTVVATVDTTNAGTLHAQWYKNGVPTGSEETSTTGTITATITPSVFGSYYVVIWNVVDGESSESITSTTAVISENAIVINCVNPTSNMQYQLDATNGNDLTVAFSCNIDAEDPSYQWYFAEGESEESNSDSAQAITGATSATYHATAVGTYFCIVKYTSKNDSSKYKTKESYHFYVKTVADDGDAVIGFDFN